MFIVVLDTERELWKSEEEEREKGKKNPRKHLLFYRLELSEVLVYP